MPVGGYIRTCRPTCSSNRSCPPTSGLNSYPWSVHSRCCLTSNISSVGNTCSSSPSETQPKYPSPFYLSPSLLPSALVACTCDRYANRAEASLRPCEHTHSAWLRPTGCSHAPHTGLPRVVPAPPICTLCHTCTSPIRFRDQHMAMCIEATPHVSSI